ncbi:MAG: 4-phosphoerythronate dehydrogenase [Rhodothermales bacterium]|nr:4-phosphoerythronate dehydrogenase [Rhodothermales bacterium]
MTRKIVADENIPFVEEGFGAVGTVRTAPGRALTAADVRDADVLLVRSVTRVDAALLEGSRVRFVGSATIGTDHVDQALLAERGIAFAHAPGSNAGSVVEYVLAALLRLAVRSGRPLRGATVGIVGCGTIGGRLARRLEHFGTRVLRNDPPRAAAAPGALAFVPLEQVLAEADAVTLHVPMTRTGPYPTHHLFDETRLRRLRPGAWLLNTARGAAVDNAALRDVLEDAAAAAVLDVWENEPTPDPALLRQTALATPHIAGYSFDGKVAGTRMLYDALCRFLGVPPAWDAAAVLAPVPGDRLALVPPDPALPEPLWLDALVRQMYDVGADDRRLRRMLTLPPEAHAAYFGELRKTYPRRRAFERHHLARAAVPAPLHDAVAGGLGVQLTG